MPAAAANAKVSGGTSTHRRGGSPEQICSLEVRAAEFNPLPEVQLDRQAPELVQSDVGHDLKSGTEAPAPEQVEARRICGLPPKKFRTWRLVFLIILVIIAVVVGCVLGIVLRHSNPP